MAPPLPPLPPPTLSPAQEQSFHRIQDHLKDLCQKTDFLNRLAKENKWNAAFTQQVVDEYVKFLFIAKEGGHPVSPSPIIDKPWHLHLLHSEDYWNQLCPKILQMPLHHSPHTGNKTEDAKFSSWGKDTVTSYQKFFGQPTLIWSTIDRASTRVWMRNTGFIFIGFSVGCLAGITDGSDAWPLFVFAAIGFSIPAIIMFAAASSPLPPSAGADSGFTCGGDSSDSGHGGHSGHSCGGGGHH